jgi:hypothetical protein
MKTITHVKLIGGQVVDLTIQPSLEKTYEIHDNILYLVPTEHQCSRMTLLETRSLGTIIAAGFSLKEVDIDVPYEFIKYISWCHASGYKPHQADTLLHYQTLKY